MSEEFTMSLQCASCGCSAREHVEPGPKMAPPIYTSVEMSLDDTLAISSRDVPCKGCGTCPKFKPTVEVPA